jgi:hypothetical protein
MFDDLKQNDATDKVDDIFAESEQDSNEPVKNPQPSVADLNLKKPEVNNSIPQFDDENKSRSKKMIKTILLIVIILVIILISAYFVYSKILLPKTLNVENNANNTTINTSINTSNESTGSTSLVGTEAGEMTDVETELEDESSMEEIIDGEENSDSIEVLKNIDSDSDGLFDYDETYVYKTDPNLFDTDNDMINDYDETMIFGTNPLLPDSDNDTYLDGKEIMSGYNPLGEGKLNPLLLKDQNLFVEKYPELAGK